MAVSIRRAAVRALAGWAALAVAAGCGSRDHNPAAPATGGPPIVIGFASNRPPAFNGGYDQYFYNVAGGGAAYMPPNMDSYADERYGGFSADGKWYAFTSTRLLTGTLAHMFLYNVATATIQVIDAATPYTSAQNVALSGDGHYLAFHYTFGSALFDQAVAFVDAHQDLVIPTPNLHLDGTGDFDPELSGDGSLIAFSSNRDTTGGVVSLGVYLYSVPGDSIVPLPGLNTPYSETGVGISADGRYIAFHSNRPGGEGLFDVYVYDRQTASLVPLPGANTPLSEQNPALSGDGRYLAYESQNDGAGNIRLYDVKLQRLIALPGLNDAYWYDGTPTIGAAP